MKITTTWFLAASGFMALASGAMASGDVAKGERDFKKCKACHTIANADEVIVKGGRTGPNLYGIVGQTAGTVEGFKYGASLIAAGEGGLVWDDDNLVTYISDPKAFLKEQTGDSSAKSKMTFKMKNGENVVAYLESLSPDS